MSITVNDILQLNILKGAKLVTGKDGLSREVSRVNFTDCPLEDDMGYSLVIKGDLYIRSFYMDQHDEKKIYDIIDFYINTESSCCLGLGYYLNEIPKKVLNLANKNHYPIIIIDDNTSYGELIRDISELIMTEQMDLLSENKIDRLLYDALSAKEISDISGYLISKLPECYFAVSIAYDEISAFQLKFLKSDLSAQFNLRLLRYHNGGFLIFDLNKYSDFSSFSEQLVKLLSHYKSHFFIGISSKYKQENFASCLKEAHSAMEIGKLTANHITLYDNLTVYNLLISLHDKEISKRYCEKILSPLKEYGERHSIDLIETVSIYLKNNGDYKKTAAILNSHENTIRFRISKAMGILGLLKEPFTFIEQVSIALKMERLMK